MANFYVTNNRYPSNPQLFTVNLSKIAKKGGEDNPNFRPTYPSAERYWTLLIYTTGLDSNGDIVGPAAADVVGGLETVTEVIDAKVEELCSLIDWSQQGEFLPQPDAGAPTFVSRSPAPNETGVSINKAINITVEDMLPAVGMDVGSLSMKVNGIVINPKITGNKYNYTFSFTPRPIYDS